MKRIAICSLLLCLTGAQGEPYELRRPLGLIEPDIPIGSPLTEGLVELGKRLFFDEHLSASGKTSCATCHNPAHGYAEARPTSIQDDGEVARRNAPSIYNAGFLPTEMWDGRYRTLEAQALDPFKPNGDMGQAVEAAVTAIRKDGNYLAQFRAALKSVPTGDGIAAALAAFERSLVSGNSAFDRYLFGGDESALSAQEKRGLDVFATRGGCLNCHDVFHSRFNPLGGGVALFSDFRFHNLGVGYALGRLKDTGRYVVTRAPEDWGAFRTPSLRNVALTGPYMHDGSLKTLEEVVDFYDRGGNPNPNLSPSIHPLYLSKSEKSDLVAFLRALTDPEAARLVAPGTNPPP